MLIRYFRIPVFDAEAAQSELDQFLRTHAVIGVEQHLVEAGLDSAWAVAVRYTAGAEMATGGTPKFAPSGKPQAGSRRSIDYKEHLSADDFTLFAMLRKLRNDLAEETGNAAYVVFTNAQLAEMAERRPASKADFSKLQGVGATRVERYADRFLSAIGAFLEAPARREEESGPAKASGAGDAD
ncbi:MAG: HRDC domain-containing protein [Pseudomonadota bacterium]